MKSMIGQMACNETQRGGYRFETDEASRQPARKVQLSPMLAACWPDSEKTGPETNNPRVWAKGIFWPSQGLSQCQSTPSLCLYDFCPSINPHALPRVTSHAARRVASDESYNNMTSEVAKIAISRGELPLPHVIGMSESNVAASMFPRSEAVEKTSTI